jgi:hypothetical protein
MAMWIGKLDAAHAAFAALRDSIESGLVADSGTVRADSLYLRARRSLDSAIRQAGRSYDGPDFQPLVYPGVYERMRKDGEPAPAAERARSDSLLRFLETRGVWSSLSEGNVYFDASEQYLLSEFGRFVTPAMREYARLEVAEQLDPTFGEGNVRVSWDELSDRLALADRFVADHPTAAARPLADDHFRRYARAFLMGLDNEDVFDRSTKRLREDVRRSYERHVSLHGSTRSGLVVAGYLGRLKASNYARSPGDSAYLAANGAILDGGAAGSPRVTIPQARADSLAALLASLETPLAPVAAHLDSMDRALRAVASRAAADSAFMRLRARLEEIVRTTGRTIVTPRLEAVAYPDGVHGQRARGREDPDSVDFVVADSVRRFFEARGVWAYGAEGDLYLEVSEGNLVRRFGDRLGPAMSDFMQIVALQQTRPYAGDGSLMISWDGLGNRVASTDRFLSEHPGTLPYEMMKDWHGRHLGFYMLGGPNTPAFEWRTKVLDPRVRSSYQRYVTTYGSTTTGRLIAEYLAVLEKNGWVNGPAVLDFLRTRSGLDDHWVPRRE